MKKLTIFVIIFIAINASVCLAENISIEQDAKISELTQISNDLRLDFNALIKSTYNKEKMTKDLTFTKANAKAIITRANNIKDNNKDQRFEDNIMLIASLYNIAINGMFTYMKNPDKNLNYLLDAHTQVKTANMLLNELKTSSGQ